MWKAYLKDGTEIVSGKWAEVPKADVVRLECCLGKKKVEVVIPPWATPVMFNTGMASSDNDRVVLLSQSIGYSNGKVEKYFRLTVDGVITEETGPAIH
jgi:hypothetical protein